MGGRDGLVTGQVPELPVLDERRLKALLGRWEDTRVTLAARTRLDDAVVARVREVVCAFAGREIAMDVKVLPAMEAGAVLYFGDAGRIVLDPRATWLSAVERGLRGQVEAGEIGNASTAYRFLERALSEPLPAASVEELRDTGSVLRVGDGVAAVTGLRDVGSQELMEFEGGTLGLAFSLRDREVGVVLLGADETVREGSDVQRLMRALKVPAGEALLGRVVDAIGRPIDGRGAVVPSAWMPVERPAPGVVMRQPVDTPLHTGIKVIDALVPIGRGQRELIIGDRKIGKTTVALDTILAQKGEDVACIYCAIGQKSSSVRSLVAVLEAAGALEYTTVVAALPGDMPAYRYLAPYTACAIGEYFLDRGQDALVVYDDLSKHAVTYREISALLDRPVGREAYPGDVFYLHSRLLERACRLADERGGGSLTALPVVETLAGDISAFIPTNVISICDGQIVLDSASFNEGRRPAMDAGLSVSRVGGTAQTRLMKGIAGRLRIDLAQYQEMARFVKFGAEVDETTQRQLTRGARARALLIQAAHTPMPLEHEALVLFGAVNGLFDEVGVEDLTEIESALLSWAHACRGELLERIAAAEGFTPELEAEMAEAVRSFVSEGTGAEAS